MARDAERKGRANETPIVDGLPDLPGIIMAMHLSKGLATHLRGLADVLLVDAFPDASLTRGERELLDTAVSAENDRFYCMDTHAAFAAELLGREKIDGVLALAESIKDRELHGLTPKFTVLISIARKVANSGYNARTSSELRQPVPRMATHSSLFS
jgi:AhpD family alkylhydroperoxidase